MAAESVLGDRIRSSGRRHRLPVVIGLVVVALVGWSTLGRWRQTRQAPPASTPPFDKDESSIRAGADDFRVTSAGMKRLGLRGLGGVSTRQLDRLLISRGYYQVEGGKGSHRKYAKPGSPMVVLPGGRKDLSPAVLRSVAKALGVPSIYDLKMSLR